VPDAEAKAVTGVGPTKRTYEVMLFGNRLMTASSSQARLSWFHRKRTAQSVRLLEVGCGGQIYRFGLLPWALTLRRALRGLGPNSHFLSRSTTANKKPPLFRTGPSYWLRGQETTDSFVFR